MSKDFGICGREKEIQDIYKFVSTKVEKNESAILYLTGPPGTGKTMSISLVLDRMKDVAKLRLNCYKAQSAKVVLSKLCESLDIKLTKKTCESSMMTSLAKKLTGRTCKSFLLVLDEMDQLPKSNNTDFFRTIFSWTKQNFSKLIIVGIANTVTLTARCKASSAFLGTDDRSVDKIIFKPYSSKDIQAILSWYLENDENLEDASVDSKVVELIAKRVAREKGDIRTAIDSLRDTVYDHMSSKRKIEQNISEPYPTPPSTPPLSPCKEKTNLAAAVSSARKRQRVSHFFDDKAPPASEIVLVCLMKLCATSKDSSVESNVFFGKIRDILMKYGTNANHLDVKSVLEQLELQGTILIRKRPRMMSDKILLKASESEISRLSHNKQMILEFVSRFI